jgi:quercetin dioxygenase-like cupin family protein
MGVQFPYHLTRVPGDVFGHYYYFPERGDGLAMHAHPRSQEHNIIVLRGSILLYGPESVAGWHEVLTPGKVFDIDDNRPHELTALEDNTMILNLMLHGFPMEYTRLEDAQFSGQTRAPTIPIPEGF